MENSGISWCDHTHNEWFGCSAPAGAGCDNCYAAMTDAYMAEKANSDKRYFGIGTAPRLTSEYNRNNPYRWDRKAAKTGEKTLVFCGSMMDFFDKNAPTGAREVLWDKINKTKNLEWQLLTKRTPNIKKMLPDDWGNGYDNVWLGTTVENKKNGLRRLEMLKNIPAKIRFLSIEPLLEDLGDIDLKGIDWVIIGGESGPNCRPMEKEWVENVISCAHRDNVPVFFKQHGGTDADAGGCLLNGIEIKEMPKSFNRNI